MGELGGTVTHIAPEIVIQRKVTKACDVFSFGVSKNESALFALLLNCIAFQIIMWEIYSGQRPYMELVRTARDKRGRDKLILSKVDTRGWDSQLLV